MDKHSYSVSYSDGKTNDTSYLTQTLDYGAIQSQVKFLQGKVLTIIEASIHDPEQRKAIKDLVKSAFSDQLTWMLQICAPELPIVSRDSLKAQGVDVDEIERTAEEIK